MIESPTPNQGVLINAAEGHVLPPALDGAELPVFANVLGPAGTSDDLFVVTVPSMHEAQLQLHRAQLFPVENDGQTVALAKFALGQAVLVEGGLPGKVASVTELVGEPGRFEYEVKPHAGGDLQRRVAESKLTSAEREVQPSPVPEGSLTWAAPGSPMGFVWPPDSDDIEVWAVDHTTGDFLMDLETFTLSTVGAQEDDSDVQRTEAAFVSHCKRFLGWPVTGPTFQLGEPEVKLLTGDTSEYADDAAAMEEGMLPLDQRMRDWLAAEREAPAEPRPLRILILEAPDDEHDLTEGLELGDVVQGSMSLVADADEVFVFRGDKAVSGKHRDREPGDVHVAIQRQRDDRVEFSVEEAQALADSFMGGSPSTEALNSATPKLEAILGKELG